MKRKIYKWISIVLSIIIFIISGPAQAAETLDAAAFDAVETADDNNWNLSIVFYDSTVNDGKTPLESIDWDASNGGYGSGTQRIITVQVNYSNSNAVTTYNPGDLTISIPNLIYSLSSDPSTAVSAQWTTSVSVSTINPSKPEDENEVWTFMNGKTSPSSSQKTFTFTNNQTLEEFSNFEGSFQIQYIITPASETPEKYFEECTHQYEKELQATLSGAADAESNTLDFDYTRTYIHPWSKVKYTIKKTLGSKISSYDGLGPGADNYIWVRYNFSVSRSTTSTSYPYITCSPIYFTDQFPEGCIIYNSTGTKIEAENNLVKTNVSFSSSSASYSYVVGYPKDTYNEENGNLDFENTADLYGRYGTDAEDSFLDDDSVTVELNDFRFEYPPGEIFAVTKSGQTYAEVHGGVTAASTKNLHYQSIIDNDSRNMIRWTVSGTANYRGTSFTVDIGDDLIYHTHADGSVQRTADDEYYFNNVTIPAMKNANDMTIPAGKYKYDIYVRYAGGGEKASEYVKFNDEPYLNDTKSVTITFPDQNVVAWFIRIHDLEESLNKLAITSDMYFLADDIPETGTIYNFDYIKGYSKDEEGNLTHLDPWDEENYINFITKEEIAEYDKNNHGNYVRRSTANKQWSYYKILDAKPAQGLTKSNVGSVVLSARDEYFYGEFKVSDKLSTSYDGTASKKELFEQLQDNDFFTDFNFYDLLPEGMEMLSSEDEIFDTITASSYSGVNFYNRNGEQPFSSNAEVTAFLKERSTVTITKNWNNTGRTRIEIKINFEDYPLFCYGTKQLSNSGAVAVMYSTITFQYRYGIPVDSLLSLGNVYKNYAYLQSKDMSSVSTKTKDDGNKDPDASDITGDGSTEDMVGYSSANAVINYLVSTHQDVTKFVLTDKIDDYKTGSAASSPDTEYSYKIRVRSGQSDITNLVIYDSIEKNVKDKDGNIVPAYGDKEYWQGEFLGVDTSFAEARTYYIQDKSNPKADADGYVTEKIHIQVWYSTDESPGGLYSDSSKWQKYPEDDTGFDKSQVKSLAFEFLDEDGKRAILPANISTYVLVKMKAPADEDITTLAYNGAWTQWQALDEHREPVDFITGINSNIVKVSLNEVVDISGTKTWVGDKEENRPEEITIVLFRDGVKYDETTTSADKDWKYSFDGLPKYRSDGSEYEYSVEENYIDGYETEYKVPIKGLNVKFNNNCAIYAYYWGIYIYYEYEGALYRYGPYAGTTLAGMTLAVPSDNFYIHLSTSSSGSANYFGFMIDSIEPNDGIFTSVGTEVTDLPSVAPIECVGDVYPESDHNPVQKTNTLWHYTYIANSADPAAGAYDIVNTGFFLDIEGTKAWAEDITEYPESVTVNLLRDGEVYRTATVNAESDWKYIFRDVPKFRRDGTEYEYSVEEEAVEGYTPSYGTLATGLAIKFNEKSKTESTKYDYVYVYYELDGAIYRLGPYGDSSIANAVIEVPAYNFWLYWHTDGSGNNFYGFSIDSIEYINKDIDVSKATVVEALPAYEITELQKGEYPETPHSPYGNSANDFWHYTDEAVWSDTPQAGQYDIRNSLTAPPKPPDLPNTGGNKWIMLLYELIGCFLAGSGVMLIPKKKKRKTD